MVKYKVNLKFKETGMSLNETITEVLKIELNKKISQLGDDIIQKMFSYYGEKLENKIVKKWIKIY